MGQNYHFSFMPNIIRILRSCSMKIFSKCPTVNISKLNFWLVICIAKNFIWTTLKMIFSIFRFFCTLRFQIYKYCPIITNHNQWKDWYTPGIDRRVVQLLFMYYFGAQMLNLIQFRLEVHISLVIIKKRYFSCYSSNAVVADVIRVLKYE